MDIFIDNQNIKDVFGIAVLDWTKAYGIASERVDNREWAGKSGIDKNLENIRYNPLEFTFECILNATNELQAMSIAKTITNYMFSKGLFVLSFRGDGLRYAMLCERDGSVNPTVHIQLRESLYYFKLGLRDVNPNALKYYTEIISGEASFFYTKGQNANIFWGDGVRGEASNSGAYIKSNYSTDGLVDIILDIDSDSEDIESLICNFTKSSHTGITPDSVQFTDLSEGDISVWSWDFGDGNGSEEQSPLHIYENEGVFDVTLQIFNSAQGTSSLKKLQYIVARRSRILINASDFMLINASDFMLKN